MPHPLLDAHRTTLDGALKAIASRGYWSPYPEMPSPKVYGETAMEDGKRAIAALTGARLDLGQPGVTGWRSADRSPASRRCRPGASLASTDAPVCVSKSWLG
jgi:hypothetical protein